MQDNVEGAGHYCELNLYRVMQEVLNHLEEVYFTIVTHSLYIILHAGSLTAVVSEQLSGITKHPVEPRGAVGDLMKW